MSEHIRDLNVTPPGGWIYTQPETSFTMTANTFAELVRKIGMHRKANNIPIGDNLAGEVESDLCARLSSKGIHDFCKDGTRRRKNVRWEEALRFMTTITAWVASGEGFVPPEEAERRAAICASCPMNVPIGGCGICKQTVEAAFAKLGGRSTPHDSKLLACSCCGCVNRAQVHVPLDALKAGLTPDMKLPAMCWKV